jgi:hypothetical protein
MEEDIKLNDNVLLAVAVVVVMMMMIEARQVFLYNLITTLHLFALSHGTSWTENGLIITLLLQWHHQRRRHERPFYSVHGT